MPIGVNITKGDRGPRRNPANSGIVDPRSKEGQDSYREHLHMRDSNRKSRFLITGHAGEVVERIFGPRPTP